MDEQHHVKRVNPIEQDYDGENQYGLYEPWHWTVWCNVLGGACGVGWEEKGGITIGGTWILVFFVVLQFFAAMATVEGEIVYCYRGYFFVFVFNCFIGCVGGIFVDVGLLDD